MISANRPSKLALVNSKNQEFEVGLKQKDRIFHLYLLGKTGTGKTNLLLTQILQDVRFFRGVCVFDVHGDLIKTINSHSFTESRNDLVYLDIPNPEMVYRYNPLRRVSSEKRSLVAGAILESFQKLWGASWGLRLEHILRYILLTLLDQPDANVGDILRIIQDESYRTKALGFVLNEDVKRFWTHEFASYSKNDLMPIYNKVGSFLAHPAIKRFLITNPEDISLRKIMDQSGVLLINLSKGQLGEDITHILGSLILSSISSAAFSRIDTPEHLRMPFHLYLDEFQSYTSKSLPGMLSELRKFGITMTLAHQYLDQLSPEILHGVLGNVGTIICFRLGAKDAAYMAKELFSESSHKFTVGDYVSLPNHHVYLKLMVDGMPSEPFKAVTFPYTDLESMDFGDMLE